MEGFDAYEAEFVLEAGVGLTVYPHTEQRDHRIGYKTWLSWDETQKLAAWLVERLDASK